VAIVLAALGVFGTGSLWPDVVVALIMGGLAISAGWHVIQRAQQEIKTGVVQKGDDGHAH
jgi:Co/Zn/Cd efflux system component